MAELLFGTAGVPHTAETRTTIDGIRRIAELGLGCMEIEFVQGVRMGEDGARLVAEVAREHGIKLSAHAPYYINMNAHEPDKVIASQERLYQTAHIGGLCGIRSAVFHPAFYLGDEPETAYQAVKKNVAEVKERLEKDGNRVRLRPELMGKPSQFGSLEEILRLCADLDGLLPCIDFSHWHARTAAYNSYEEFSSMLKQIEEKLGRTALEDLHVHFSGINYGPKGEKNHLDLKESDMHYTELLQALKDSGAGGLVVCESPNLEEDAVMIQEIYNGLS